MRVSYSDRFAGIRGLAGLDQHHRLREAQSDAAFDDRRHLINQITRGVPVPEVNDRDLYSYIAVPSIGGSTAANHLSSWTSPLCARDLSRWRCLCLRWVRDHSMGS